MQLENVFGIWCETWRYRCIGVPSKFHEIIFVQAIIACVWVLSHEFPTSCPIGMAEKGMMDESQVKVNVEVSFTTGSFL